ncbi:galactosyltransferase-related protein [Priestia megaterium]|uniref:galactosyltransferase-related protein n=1 Tax=Priestia megaterium TaxID=1404 RepID=UPI003EEE9111
MLNQVSVLIPYKPDHGIRDNLFKWIKFYYKDAMPEVELCIGKSNSEPFNRSEAINTAAKKATKDVFVIADADVIYDPSILIQAIQLLNKNAWVIPYDRCLNISKSSTEILLNSFPEWPIPIEVKSKERIFKNGEVKPVSGVIVVTRENFNIVKGFDERFIGWGREDDAFKDAMNTLCGPYKRITENSIYHLWHPKVGFKGNPNIKNNNKLYRQYVERNGDVEGMRKLTKANNRYKKKRLKSL